ncbi:MAG: hypothetical protein F6K54_19490 [Okeania sp. SIO3B5]|uniref:hypothetical protein n=1 Tax=Okeania sp. SIO3B5 TaxID=2607811 RepID=UPI0013FF3967|nr:hypothetical protein [Okeania sp. SIO3B5]NEO55066.1 hypothetical protein [Okeania sp. SIO3B5]
MSYQNERDVIFCQFSSYSHHGYSQPQYAKQWVYLNVGIYTRALLVGSVGMNANQCYGFTRNMLKCQRRISK